MCLRVARRGSSSHHTFRLSVFKCPLAQFLCLLCVFSPVASTHRPEEVIQRYMEVVAAAPDEVTCLRGSSHTLSHTHSERLLYCYCDALTSPPQDCIICMDQLSNPSGYETPSTEEGGQSHLPDAVGKFVKCGHTLHMLCMLAMYNNGTKVLGCALRRGSEMIPARSDASCAPPQDGSLQCPSCKTIYGEKTGTQPKGKMEIYSVAQSLPGHPDCGTIQIIYSIAPGIQVGPHPEPCSPEPPQYFM